MKKYATYIAFGFLITLFIVGLVMVNYGIIYSDTDIGLAGLINGSVGFLGFVLIGIEADIL